MSINYRHSVSHLATPTQIASFKNTCIQFLPANGFRRVCIVTCFELPSHQIAPTNLGLYSSQLSRKPLSLRTQCPC